MLFRYILLYGIIINARIQNQLSQKLQSIALISFQTQLISQIKNQKLYTLVEA